MAENPEPSARRRRFTRRAWLAAAAVGCALLLLVGYRLTRTAEFIAAFGSDRARADLCRAAPNLGPERRRRILSRLLSDRLETVRIAAATAVGKSPADTALDDRVEGMLRDPATPRGLRTRAGEVLLGRRDVRPSVLSYLGERSEDPRFRRDCAPVVARLCERRLPTMSEGERRRMLACTLDEADPVREHLRDIVLDHVRDFAAFRETFVQALERDPSFETRKFVLSALCAVDGLMRGEHADDWRERALERLGKGRPHVYEVEWAHDIRPNYHVTTFKGRLCVALGEGAGGVLHWLKGLDGTADVGGARFSLYVPEDGRYGLWARVYFDDKCGNSFGIRLDGVGFANFPDQLNVMDEWHWLHLRHGEASSVPLEAGLHRGRLQAWEDGVFLDGFVLLPEGLRPEDLPETPAVVWDRSLASSISFDVDWQAQPRGTTQYVAVWVRRHSPELTGGAVELKVPAPFEMLGSGRHGIRFAEGDPLCRTSFRVRLPSDAVAGEGVMEAVYTDVKGERVAGRSILGAQYDWLCTGPLGPEDALHRELSEKTTVTDEELSPRWAPYPQKGIDTYRRLDFEKAYGRLQNVHLYLVTDVLVEEGGDYAALLTADDTAYVYIDGRLAVSQEEEGPCEGRMVTRALRLTAGRHRIFVRHYQSDFAEPEGPESPRHTPNHCAFKLLLRRGRHTPAPVIKGLPMRPR